MYEKSLIKQWFNVLHNESEKKFDEAWDYLLSEILLADQKILRSTLDEVKEKLQNRKAGITPPICSIVECLPISQNSSYSAIGESLKAMMSRTVVSIKKDETTS